MGKLRAQAPQRSSGLNSGNAQAWQERLRQEDRLDNNNRTNLAKLRTQARFEDRPARGAERQPEPSPGDLDSARFRQLHRWFRQADRHGSGRIDLNELRWLCSQNALKLDSESATRLIERMDAHGDGLIDYAEFARGLRELHPDFKHLPPTPSTFRSERGLAGGLAGTGAEPADGAQLVPSTNPYNSQMYARYKTLRMLMPANLSLTVPPQKTTPNTSLTFHETPYRTKNRSIKSWQDYQQRQNVLIQRTNSFPGVPTYKDTGVSTYQTDFTHGGPVVDPGAYSASKAGGLNVSYRDSEFSLTATVASTRKLHTSKGLVITRTVDPVERDYTRDPVARMLWTQHEGWASPAT